MGGLNVGNLNLAGQASGGANYDVDLTSNSAGTAADLLNVTGSVTIGAAATSTHR